MNARQTHRGPDDAGVFRDERAHIALAMRRLAIIDIAGGAQPMRSADGRYTLVYNGELFNAPDLRADLEAAGARFSTDHSDTEVLLHLLVQDGKACLPRLNGMFAFALYDNQAGSLLCARDRFGIKPLHYTRVEGRFAFASEIKSLLELPFVSAELDQQSAFDYLSLMYVAGERTAFRHIERVPPGGLLHYDLATGAVRVERWWRMHYRPDRSVAVRDWPAQVADTLGRAVKRWAWSDVPVAVSLSGGLDSSAIAGYAAIAGIPIRSFSLGFSGHGEAGWNELPLARKVAQKWGLEHEEIVLNPESLIDELPRMVAALDEPYGGGLPSWFVFEGMGRAVKVGLTGTGGDEMFGNYGKWTALEGGVLGRWFRRRLADCGRQVFERDFFQRYYYAEDTLKRTLFSPGFSDVHDTAASFHERFVDGHNAGESVRDAVAALDIGTQLAGEFLLMTDRFSMAHGVEARTPFLDNEMVDLVSRIPADVRTGPRALKGLLRKAVAPVLPPELVNARKKGFVIPLGQWMRGRLRPLVKECLGADHLRRQGIFNPAAVSAMACAHLDGTADHTPRLWALLMFQLWHQNLARA